MLFLAQMAKIEVSEEYQSEMKCAELIGKYIHNFRTVQHGQVATESAYVILPLTDFVDVILES